MKILCLGNVVYDITFPLEEFPVENIKYRVEEKVVGGGGPASNAAYLLGKWGANVFFSGTIGNDFYGKQITNEFKSVNVKTKYIEVDKNNETGLGFILVNKKNGSRTILSYRPSDMKLNKKIKDKFDVILIDGQEYEKSIEVLKSNPNAISIIDAGRVKEPVVELCKMVNYVVCSKNFAEEYTSLKIDINDEKNIEEVFLKLTVDFKNVVITLEDKGTLYKENNLIKIVPSINVVPKDSTGAGDYFHGAFAYSLANNFDIEKSIKISNITGALSVTKVGARNSAPSLAEVMNIYNQNV
jgi:sugar/nucleoside kinase (ribokinase family)